MGSFHCSDSAGTCDNIRRCFICCSGRPADLESANKSSFDQLSLRNIFRYLHFLIPLDLKDGDGEVTKFSDLVESVGVCEQCSHLAVEFNELYHILEVTKLRLDWCLRKLQDVMTKADNEPQTKGADMNENGMLRRDLIGRLNRIVPIPRVALCKTEVLPLHLPEEPIPSPTYHSDAEDWNGEFDENDTMDCPSVSKTPEPVAAVTEVEVHMKREIDIDKVENLRRNNTHHSPKPIRIKPKKETPIKYLKCSFCRAQFKKSNSKAADFLHRHVAHHHCDKLFSNHKLDSVTDTDFQRIVGLYLFKDLISEKEDTFCAYCNKRFTNSKRVERKILYISQIKGHMIQAHYEMLEEKLLMFQRDPDLHKVLSESGSIGEICECGVYLQNHLSRVAHDKWHCPLTAKVEQENGTCHLRQNQNQKTDKSILSNFIRPSASSKLKCKLCKKSLTNKKAHAIRHWKYYCAKGERLPTPKGDNLSCDYCGHQCPNRMHHGKTLMKTHIVRLHPEHYFLSEMKMDFVTKWKREHFKSIVAQVLFPKFDSGDRIRVASCSLCTVDYKKGDYGNKVVSLRKHLINHHKQELRESLKVILEDSDESLKNLLKSSGIPRIGSRAKSKSKVDSEFTRKITLKTEVGGKEESKLEFMSEVKACENDIFE